eukprot:CAMPEP_0116882880 /NCGR_PEP_ID=MMETSP0463-20121206/15278_1 /TAXON_ID=181622 /ORGANISM="Strombidinopsis sp, Strain SopsisLIS2011" /LENGTH=272 /DNA_ID=CAMNT_0004536839 /DNA_START=1987 /DNA_END=2805 /DNA_ORIENTATION=+
MDRLLRDHWSSKVDAGGNLLGNATAYKILTQDSLDYIHDFERNHRFYEKRDSVNVKPHKLMFRVWWESMEVRYFIEVFMFIVLTANFQYYITVFNGDYHAVVIDLHLYEKMALTMPLDHPEMVALSDRLHEEIDHAVLDLNEAMVVGIVTFTYPVKQFLSYLFMKWTRRSYSFKMEYFIDLALCGCVAEWIERFQYYHTHHVKHFFADSETDASNTNFMLNIVVNNESGEFHFDYLLAIVGVLFWLRLFLMLRLTRTLGPLIKIIEAMVFEL